MVESINSLAARCQQDDKDAWQQLVGHLHLQVEAHVLYILKRYGLAHLGNNHLQDIINFIWEDLIKNIFKFNTHDFELWFAYRRVKRVLDYARKECKCQAALVGSGQDFEMADFTSADDFQNLIFSRQVLDMVDKLPMKYALFLKLFYWEGLPYKEIAQWFGIKTSSVGGIHGRAIKKFKKLHKKEFAALK